MNCTILCLAALARLSAAGPMGTWPLEVVGDRAFVRVGLPTRTEARLLLDTGATWSSLARRCVPPGAQRQGATDTYTVVSCKSISIGLNAYVFDESQDRERFTRRREAYGDGILGLDAFTGMRVGVDLSARRLTFYSGSAPIEGVLRSYFPSRSEQSFDRRDGGYSLLATEIEGVPVPLIPDTGSERTVLREEEAARVPLPEDSSPYHVEFFEGSEAARRFTGLHVHVATGEMNGREVVVSRNLPSAHGVLGFPELRSLRLLWDLTARRLYVGRAGGKAASAQESSGPIPVDVRGPVLASKSVVRAPLGVRVHVGSDVMFTVPEGYTIENLPDGGHDLVPPPVPVAPLGDPTLSDPKTAQGPFCASPDGVFVRLLPGRSFVPKGWAISGLPLDAARQSADDALAGQFVTVP